MAYILHPIYARKRKRRGNIAPTYTLTRSPTTTTVDEGTTVTFTLTTTNVANNTTVPYTITGVSSADINNAALTGNFTVGATGTATLPITFTNDSLTEGSETLTLTLNTQGTSLSVSINDTSMSSTLWYQKGSTLTETSPNFGGYGVSIGGNGNVVVSTGRTSTSSFISVNRWNNNSWTNTKITIPVHSQGNAELQTSISDDGNVIACVYRNHEFEFPINTSVNYAAVYAWNGNSWNQLGNSFATTSNQDAAVAISGNGLRVAITDNRQVKVYSWNNSVWNQDANTITPPYPETVYLDDAGWGQYVSLDYTGANIAISNTYGSSGVYIFTYSFNAWNLNKYFDTIGIVDAVTLRSTTDNKYIIAYASFTSAPTPYIAIHKSELGNTSGTWNSRGEITITGPESSVYNPDISMSIDKDGNRVIWSTKQDYDVNGNFTNSTIRVVDWNGSNWIQTGTITPDPPNSNSGHSIALSQDGQTIAFGAPNYNNVKVYSTQVF